MNYIIFNKNVLLIVLKLLIFISIYLILCCFLLNLNFDRYRIFFYLFVYSGFLFFMNLISQYINYEILNSQKKRRIFSSFLLYFVAIYMEVPFFVFVAI